MWADGEKIPVKAGDAVLAPEGSDHRFRIHRLRAAQTTDYLGKAQPVRLTL